MPIKEYTAEQIIAFSALGQVAMMSSLTRACSHTLSMSMVSANWMKALIRLRHQFSLVEAFARGTVYGVGVDVQRVGPTARSCCMPQITLDSTYTNRFLPLEKQ
jgi:hypothetical protein